ncbi:Xanthomonas XOO_2897-like deaminase [Streptomyces zhaozhouensis]|uniref:Xanthomonas XOO_2897-like deaminase n=1 Tax=Streptomyces zhaozhouensis TaxID=1300267 RepID=A0A286DXR7_9ACTN|nr:SUKH-4 family immunity protein [Streptomyces zhaozhouensis]SOD63459.1 Xanthomonas XOO_2897-like deaminase [Streptomyces zhaozhouensis]
MVTFAQAQERAERWVDGAGAEGQKPEVRVREFDLGFVAWAEDASGSEVGGGRLVIARESGEATYWPRLPVGEVIRRYEEEYGPAEPAAPAAPEPPKVMAEEATSFMLTPPKWLQEAGDKAGVPGGAPGNDAPKDQTPPKPEAPGPFAPPRPEPAAPPPVPAPAVPPPPAPFAAGPPKPEQPERPEPAADSPWAAADVTPRAGEGSSGGASAGGASPWAGTDTSGSADEAESMAPPLTVFSPPVLGDDDKPSPSAAAEAKTTVMPQGSSLPPTAVAPPPPGAPAGPPPGIPDAPPGAPMGPPPAPPGGPGTPPPPPAAGIADEETHKARVGGPGAGMPVPPPPSAPGTPRPGQGQADEPTSGEEAPYVATRMVDPDVVSSVRGPGGGTPPPPGAPAGPPPPPGAGPGPMPAPPGAPPQGTPPPGAGPGTPPPPAPGAGTPPPQSYGYPQEPQPAVGSGYMAVLRYRGPDGSEQQLIRRSAPGMPHPEWQILHELMAMQVPAQQVIELHTELQSCELPGGYCARMIRETWPQVRITHTAAYGTDFASRQAGVRHLVEHQDELQQFADGPQRSAPVRAPLPQQAPAPAVGLDVIGQELAEAFGPQLVFRYEPHFASRQGVPEIVANTLTWSGLPVELPPFFWARAQPGAPIPTLAEVAMERGVQPAPDAGSYLVVGSDFGKQLCVQYGTAHIVAVPLEAGPGGQPVPPQFVNASLPQFARSMALLGRMWRLRYGLTSEQAGRWTKDFQAQLASLDPMTVADPESWWSVLLEQMWDGLL